METKTITIISAEAKQTANGKAVVKIKDEKNLTYSLWLTKQDGAPSVAGTFYQTLPNNGINKQVDITFNETQGDYNGKAVTYRNIIGMKLSTEQPGFGSQLARQGMAKEAQENEEDKWEKINAKRDEGMKKLNAINNACLLIANGKADIAALQEIVDKIYKLEPTKELKDKLGEADWAGQSEPVITTEEIPF